MSETKSGLSSFFSGIRNMTNGVLAWQKKEARINKDALAAFLRTTPQALAAFEQAYQKEILDTNAISFDGMPNAKQAAEIMEREVPENLSELIDHIVNELIAQTPVYRYDGKTVTISTTKLPDHRPVSKEEVMSVPQNLRPGCTGTLIAKDLNTVGMENGEFLLSMYQEFLTSHQSPAVKQQIYHRFRQGLDLLDLDELMYAMIAKNPDSMEHWLPALVDAVAQQDYFKVPKTTMIQVPISMLQLTRLAYASHTPTTLKIVDDYCYRVFGLDETQTYFIRTGTASLKYDFRNVKVTGAKEVHELGEYLLYNHHRGVEMAGPLTQPSIYGMQTTVEWAVREYIEPLEPLPEIYFGLPLRMEMRIFIDATEKRILGVAPYWDPKTMKDRLSMDDDFRNPDKIHDYITYSAYEPTLMKKYEIYKDKIVQKVEELLPYLDLDGQWSLDVMFNGIDANGKEDVYLIDMALASRSALREYVPAGRIKEAKEDWIPEFTELQKSI